MIYLSDKGQLFIRDLNTRASVVTFTAFTYFYTNQCAKYNI